MDTPDSRPAAVVFDLGNVLIRWDPHPAIAAGVGAEEATRFLTADDFDFAAWNHAQDAGRTWQAAEEAACASHPHWAAHLRSYRRHFVASLTGVVEDTVGVLEDLHRAGVRLAALTNWSDELFPVALRRYPFLALFEQILVSGTERLAKPDPAVFRLLGERLGMPLPRLVFVDDKTENVHAARRLGIDAIRFEDTGHLRADLRERGLPIPAYGG